MNVQLFSVYMDQIGQILPRRETGLSKQSQNAIAKGIRRARSMGLLGFTYCGKSNYRYHPIHAKDTKIVRR